MGQAQALKLQAVEGSLRFVAGARLLHTAVRNAKINIGDIIRRSAANAKKATRGLGRPHFLKDVQMGWRIHVTLLPALMNGFARAVRCRPKHEKLQM